MASLRERKGARGVTSWAVLFRHDGRQRSETFRGPGSEVEAAKFAEQIDRLGPAAAIAMRDAYSNGGANDDAAPEPTPTVTEYVLHHIGQISGIEEGTRSDYRSYVRLSIDGTRLGRMPIDAVTAEDVETWINQLAASGGVRGKGLSGKSIANRHSLLSAALSRAVRNRIRSDNPAKGLSLPESEREDMTFLTHGEFAILLHHVPRYWAPLVAALPGTGLRWSEITALQIRDLHLDDIPATLSVVRAWKHTDSKARLLKALPKSRAARRSVSLAPQLVGQFRPLIDGRRHDDFVFVAPRGGPVRHADFLASVWQVAVARATMVTDADGNEIPADRRITKRPRIHDMRHTYASWMVAQGMNLTELQYAMGHESIKTTSDRYTHLMPGHRERAAEFAQIALAQALPELEG